MNHLKERNSTKEWSDYLKIFGCRNHCIMGGKPVSEIVYIHSKLLIVDDERAILGSANLNDRSMRGYHDSELAICAHEKPVMSELVFKNVVQKEKELYREFNVHITSMYKDSLEGMQSGNMTWQEQLSKEKQLQDEIDDIIKQDKQNIQDVDTDTNTISAVQQFRIDAWKSLFNLENSQWEYYDYVPQSELDIQIQRYEESLTEPKTRPNIDSNRSHKIMAIESFKTVDEPKIND